MISSNWPCLLNLKNKLQHQSLWFVSAFQKKILKNQNIEKLTHFVRKQVFGSNSSQGWWSRWCRSYNGIGVISKCFVRAQLWLMEQRSCFWTRFWCKDNLDLFCSGSYPLGGDKIDWLLQPKHVTLWIGVRPSDCTQVGSMIKPFKSKTSIKTSINNSTL